MSDIIRQLKCNQPQKNESGGKKFVVKACSKGQERIVRFGDATMSHFKEGGQKGKGHGDQGRRDNFRARHNCAQKSDPFTPGYWSCRHSW